MALFIQKLQSSSPEESENLFKSATAAEREALITYLSSNKDVSKSSPGLKKFIKIFGTIAAYFLFKGFQELLLYLNNG